MMPEKAHFLGWETFFGGWMYFCSLRLSLEELQNNPSFQVGEIRWNYMLVDVFVLYGYLRAWVLHVPWHLIQYPLGWPLSSTGWYQRPQGYKWLRFIVNDWLLNQSKLESQGITCFRGNKLNRKRIQQRKIRCYVKLQTNRERTKNLSLSRFPISAWCCSIACSILCAELHELLSSLFLQHVQIHLKNLCLPLTTHQLRTDVLQRVIWTNTYRWTHWFLHEGHTVFCMRLTDFYVGKYFLWALSDEIWKYLNLFVLALL